MAIFNFGGVSIDTTQTDSADLTQALKDAGVTINGSIVGGNTYGVSGGTHHGDVYGTERKND
ncbi:hypothetical protein [Streptomyces hydrogenans]|uniref:Uncharacterized protein n=1 Tax=Streptomyces hydrogenans TaxID=1873719 RepID=A0ABQ3P3A2_9ACTN|nr:hypothetical protein [Streptomyces hydrogenans]GHG12422.1 hypothetical protein GCM10018784_26590 [Streptomyces hydrogenans]GHI19488.1 hypothetical protein Shyd_08590 [Streptomyces hydrogenans]